jgi:hypothetical protein
MVDFVNEPPRLDAPNQGGAGAAVRARRAVARGGRPDGVMRDDSGLVFTGEATGEFGAFDARTGSCCGACRRAAASTAAR